MLRVFFFAFCGTAIGITGGVAWSLHDTVTNGNNLFGHWFPAVITAIVGAVLGLVAGSTFGLGLLALSSRTEHLFCRPQRKQRPHI